MGGRQGPISSRPAVSYPAPKANAGLVDAVEDLRAKHADLARKLDAHSQAFDGIDKKIDTVIAGLNQSFLQERKALGERLEQQKKQVQEPLNKKSRPSTPSR
jgi:ABC-type transporter Mla subunit MlaD